MKKFSREKILKIAEEKNVEFIRLQFVDILGIIKMWQLQLNSCQKHSMER